MLVGGGGRPAAVDAEPKVAQREGDVLVEKVAQKHGDAIVRPPTVNQQQALQESKLAD